MTMGHTNASATFVPQVEDATSSVGGGHAFADCPGFLDNRGFEINVANIVNVKQTVRSAESAVVVVVVNYHALRADRGKGMADLLTTLVSLFGSVASVRAHAPSLLLALSHAPVAHPVTGAALTLEHHTRTLLDPSGLGRPEAEALAALGGRLVLYDLCLLYTSDAADE